MAPTWASLGQHIIDAFQHVYIINLERSVERRSKILQLLRDTLRLHQGYDFSFPYAVDCEQYGRWPEKAVPHPPGSATDWWLHQRTCKRGAERHQMASKGGCLRTEFDKCRNFSNAYLCGGVCYTLSVAAGLRHFLGTNRSHMLLLEDDVCLTRTLQQSIPMLRSLAPGNRQWSIARLGHCFEKARDDNHNVVEIEEVECRGPVPEAGREAQRRKLDQEHSQQMVDGLGRSFCAHALAVDRLGAERLLRLAFPVRAFFDDILFALGGGYGEKAQEEMLAQAGVASIDSLHAVHTSLSLFGQGSTLGEVESTIYVEGSDAE